MEYKQTTIGKCKDNTKFKLSKTSRVWYTVQRRQKLYGLKTRTQIVATSDKSGLTFVKPDSTKCFVEKP